MTKNDSKMTKNDEKMAKKAQIDAYRAYLMAEIEKAEQNYTHYISSENGEWRSKKLANQWLREANNLNMLLDKEFTEPEEFELDAEWFERRNAFGLH